MKKQIKKLSLNKKTISNLSASEMSLQVGGSTGCYPQSKGNWCGNPQKTKNGNTCYGHATCYNC